jgi:hypothetical protein
VRKGTKDGLVHQPGFRPDRAPPRDSPQPLKTLTDKLALFDEPALERIPGTYVLTVGAGRSDDEFDPQAERARRRGFTVVRMTADHVPERSAPGPLVDLLLAAR